MTTTKLTMTTMIVLSALLAASCGGSNPTQPSNTYPDVGGSYAGTATIAYTTLGVTLNCPVTTSVVQNGANVSIAPIVFGGSCATLGSVPVGDGTITTTGSLGSATQTVPLASCGGNYSAAASGGFFGRTLQFSLAYSALSGACIRNPGNFSITANLSH